MKKKYFETQKQIIRNQGFIGGTARAAVTLQPPDRPDLCAEGGVVRVTDEDMNELYRTALEPAA